MCPVCITTAVLIAGSATSTGGLTAIAIKKFGVKNAVVKNSTPASSDLFRKENGIGEIISYLHQRRDQDVS